MSKGDNGSAAEPLLQRVDLENVARRVSTSSIPAANPDLSDSSLLAMIPGVLVGALLLVFDSVPYGLIVFPSGTVLEEHQVLGVYMFLATTISSQIVFASISTFNCAISSMMMENLPFLQSIALTVIANIEDEGNILSTVFAFFAFSTVVCAVIFFLLGFLNAGSLMQFFPRHVLIGCIGGVGLFLVMTSFEVATGVDWDSTSSAGFYNDMRSAIYFVLTSWKHARGAVAMVGAKICLSTLIYLQPFAFPSLGESVVSPAYFVALPLLFFAITGAAGLDLATLRNENWLYPDFEGTRNFTTNRSSAMTTAPLGLWTAVTKGSIEWQILPACFPMIVANAFFAILHVPINVPSLMVTVSPKVGNYRDLSKDNDRDENDEKDYSEPNDIKYPNPFSLNHELIVHGFSNLVGGLCSGLPNYICYSNSALFFTCNGSLEQSNKRGGQKEGTGCVGCESVPRNPFKRERVGLWILLAVSIVLYSFGIEAAAKLAPRFCAGLLVLHIGLALLYEALVDMYSAMDGLEYGTVVTITLVMNFYGFEAGVLAGVLLACLSFVVNSSTQSPIHASYMLSYERDKAWTSTEVKHRLHESLRGLRVIQLKGNLFFGNASQLTLHFRGAIDDLVARRSRRRQMARAQADAEGWRDAALGHNANGEKIVHPAHTHYDYDAIYGTSRSNEGTAMLPVLLIDLSMSEGVDFSALTAIKSALDECQRKRIHTAVVATFANPVLMDELGLSEGKVEGSPSLDIGSGFRALAGGISGLKDISAPLPSPPPLVEKERIEVSAFQRSRSFYKSVASAACTLEPWLIYPVLRRYSCIASQRPAAALRMCLNEVLGRSLTVNYDTKTTHSELWRRIDDMIDTAHMSVQRVSRGQKLWEKDDDANGLVLLLSGVLHLTRAYRDTTVPNRINSDTSDDDFTSLRLRSSDELPLSPGSFGFRDKLPVHQRNKDKESPKRLRGNERTFSNRRSSNTGSAGSGRTKPTHRGPSLPPRLEADVRDENDEFAATSSGFLSPLPVPRLTPTLLHSGNRGKISLKAVQKKKTQLSRRDAARKLTLAHKQNSAGALTDEKQESLIVSMVDTVLPYSMVGENSVLLGRRARKTSLTAATQAFVCIIGKEELERLRINDQQAYIALYRAALSISSARLQSVSRHIATSGLRFASQILSE